MREKSQGTIHFKDFRKTAGVEVVYGKQVTHQFSRHTHRSLCLGIVEQGIRTFYCRGKKQEVVPGQIFLIPPGEAHVCGSVDYKPHTYRQLCIPPETFELMPVKYNDPGQRFIFRQLIINDQNLFKALFDIHEILIGPEPIFVKQSSVMHVLEHIIANYSGETIDLRDVTKQNETIRKILIFIEENFSESLTLHDIASIACLSPFHLVRVFTRTTGVPPHVYQQQVRIRHARRMLQRGAPIVQVAVSTGFNDQSYFTRIFKKMMGVTPGDYARG